ncbi:hypothetical protein B7494_g7705 [Chlorociboria aeruginascens]|nr:hypothetical protein B7494_g7705 [Chlorociboria aeruginascens]
MKIEALICSSKPTHHALPTARHENNRRILSTAADTAVATQKVTPHDSLSILAEQRKKRPTAPHLTIYKWQITSVASIMTRMTGGALAGGFYVFGSAYLLSPLLGWHLDSASIAAAFGALPLAVKVLAKFAVAMPFTFHSFNGVRHLAWDLGLGFKNKEVIRTGMFMTGVSVASALGLALLL